MKESGWSCAHADTQDRLYGFDVDDQGYAYFAYTFWGWGIAKDPGGKAGLMQSPLGSAPDQITDSLQTPFLVLAVKTNNGQYYALVTDSYSPTVDLYDVSNRQILPVRTGSYQHGILTFAKTPGLDRIAHIDPQGTLRTYTSDTPVRDGTPLKAGSGTYPSVITH